MDFWRNVGEYLSGKEGWIPGRDTAGKVKTTLNGGDADWVPSVSAQGGARNPVGPTIGGIGAQMPSSSGGGRGDRGGGSGDRGGGDTALGSSNALGSSTYAPGGGGAALPALNQAAINNTQIALDQLPALLDAALRAEATRRDNTLRGFNDQEAGQRKQYDASTVTNQQNYDANYMDSIRAGVKGLSGLFNILRGTGASGGTAQDMVRDTVAGVTSNDIRTGADTRSANQTALDTSLSTFLTELKGKRQAAEDTFRNNESAYRRDNLSQQQDLMSKMASYYSDGGRAAEATNWMNRAGSLTPAIAQNSMARQSSYDTTPVAVKAPELAAFSAPSQPDVEMAAPDQVGAGIFTMNRKKEQQQDLPVPVGV